MKYIISQPKSIYELGQRANQEDNIFPEHGSATINDNLFIVCDGMGGHESGEIASSTVCAVMSNYIKSKAQDNEFDLNLFQAALSATYNALDAKDNGELKKMGTTMTFMMLHSKGCLLAHIGDSRIYHIRPSKGQILYKSRDHSLVNDLYDLGEITLEEMKTSRQKNIITRVIQPLQERRSKASVKYVDDIEVGDYFYLCTDGMLENMEDENILNVISMDTSDDDKVRILTEITFNNKDNHSAYLVRIEDIENNYVQPIEPIIETVAYSQEVIVHEEEDSCEEEDAHYEDEEEPTVIQRFINHIDIGKLIECFYKYRILIVLATLATIILLLIGRCASNKSIYQLMIEILRQTRTR